MRITFEIVDSKVEGFSSGAVRSLKLAAKEYANGIVDEAKRIEQIDRMGSANIEVIASHVDEAKKNYRRAPIRKKHQIIIDVFVEILLLAVGAMFDKAELLANNIYLIIYIAVVILTLILLIVKYSKGA